MATRTHWAEREELSRSFPPPLPHKLESMRGPGASNIVIKSFAVAGAHPGSTTSEIVSNLTPLLRAGITTFVCLQHELPRAGHAAVHQRSAYGTSNVVTAKNYLADAQAIVDAGGFPQSGGPPLSLLHLPITDASGATVPDDVLKPFVLDLLAHMKAGEYLYIQCGDGNGRTGVVAAILLGLAYGLSSSEALDLSQRCRNDRPGAHGVSPESHEQKMQVHRLLSDASFRALAAATLPRHSNSSLTDESGRLEAVLRKVRSVVAKKGAMSLIYLRRYALTLTRGGSEVTPDAFARLCNDAEWHLTPEEGDTLWNAAQGRSGGGGGGSGRRGVVSFETIFRLARGTMPPRRRDAVHDAFRRLAGGTGYVPIERLAASFHPETHPDVRATRRTAEEVKSEFYDTFGIGAKGDGGSASRSVSAAEFEAYYADISTGVEDDAYFDLLIFGSWPTGGDAPGSAGGGGGRATLASRMAGGTPTRASARTPESVLTQAYVASLGGPAAAASSLGRELTQTEHGYSFLDVGNPRVLIPALKAYLTTKSDFTIALLGATLRRHDARRDGCVDLVAFRSALRDAGAALPDSDSELAFASLARVSLGGGGGGGGDTSRLNVATARVPLSDILEAVRTPLNDSRRSVVLSAFNEFDQGATGAVPVATIVLAFNAEAYPAVATGKLPVHVVYKNFQDSFAEGFALLDKFGPAARAFGYGSPAQRAYYGQGDGLVRFPFFEEFHEALGTAIVDDSAFAMVVGHIWSGIRRGHRAHLDPSTVASRAEVHEAGFLSSMARLSSSHPFAPVAGSGVGAPALPTRSFAKRGDALIGTAVARPPTHVAPASPPPASAAGGRYGGGGGDGGRSGGGGGQYTATGSSSGAPLPGEFDRGRRHMAREEEPSLFTGGDGYTGLGGSAMRGSPRKAVVPGAVRAAYAPAPPTGNEELDAALGVMRDILMRRGPRSMHMLLHAVEAAVSTSSSGGGGATIYDPMPVTAFQAVLRDASFGLSPRQLEFVVAQLEARSRSGPRTLIPHLLFHLLRGDLSRGRADIVRQAYAHASRRAGRFPHPPTLDDVRMLYASAAHPDVSAMKRDEEAVLREFLETFDGPTYVDARAGGVTLEGFTEYYTNLSFYYPDDMHFGVVVFDTWALSRDEGAEGVAAGKPTITQPTALFNASNEAALFGGSRSASDSVAFNGGASGVSSAHHSPVAQAYGARQREGTWMPRDSAHPPPQSAGGVYRGHGLERLGYGPAR